MDSKNKKYRILLTGGGTGGSVTPLLAVAEELNSSPCHFDRREKSLEFDGKTAKGFLANARNDNSREVCDFEFLWLGTKFGVERAMVEKAGIRFKAISGGKWRRYFSLKNLADIFKIKIGFWQAFFIMLKWRPNLVMSAGSFISVPVALAAWLLRVPVLIHQQDVQPGLANKLMAPFARIVTVTFEKSLKDYGKKAVWTGNMVRREIGNLKFEIGELRKRYRISEQLPVVLIVGGGTGAVAINKLVEESLNELIKFCQVIHVIGKNKGAGTPHPSHPLFNLPLGQGENILRKERGYYAYEFLNAEQIAEALNLAEVVVSRAGLGVLSELSYLSKPAIIIPMPDSHQTENAAMFKNAAVVLEQKDLTAAKFVNEIKSLLGDEARRKMLSEKMGRVMKRGANEAMAKIILGLLK